MFWVGGYEEMGRKEQGIIERMQERGLVKDARKIKQRISQIKLGNRNTHTMDGDKELVKVVYYDTTKR